MRCSVLVLATLLLPLLVHCKSEMEYVSEGQSKTTTAHDPAGADANVQKPPTAGSGSGAVVSVGDGTFTASSPAVDAEVGSSPAADASPTGSGSAAPTDAADGGNPGAAATPPATADAANGGKASVGGGSAGATPAKALVVDWGAGVRFDWRLPGCTTASINLHSDVVPYDQTRPLTAKTDLPNGEWPLDTSTLEPGPYIATLTVVYPARTDTFTIFLRIRPVLHLFAADAGVAAVQGLSYPIWVEVPAGADRVRLYLNSATASYSLLTALAHGKFPGSATPDLVGANVVRGTIVKNTVRGRPASLDIAAVAPCAAKTGCSDGSGSASGSGKGGPSPGPAPMPTPPGKVTPAPPTPAPPAPPAPTPVPVSPTHDPNPDGDVAIGAHILNNFPGNCTRLEIRGPVGSTETTEGPQCTDADHLSALGDWFAAKLFHLPPTVVKGALKTGFKLPPLPRDTDKDGIPDFPVVDYPALGAKVGGTLQSSALPASSWHPAIIPAVLVSPRTSGNVVVIGNADHPFRIDGDVVIQGDLVIKGRYTGAGTIYVTGNIFIPHDVVAVASAFPFSTDPAAADAEGKARVASAKDALALVAGGAIFVGDNYPQYTNPLTNPWVQAMYSWYPGGKPAYRRLYEPVWNCQTQSIPVFQLADYDKCDCHIHGGFSLIEASLYAWNGVHGASGAYTDNNDYVPNSFAINGTVLATSFDVVSTPDQCANTKTPHPTHGYPQDHSYLNLDWRLNHGVKEFSWLKAAYKTP